MALSSATTAVRTSALLKRNTTAKKMFKKAFNTIRFMNQQALMEPRTFEMLISAEDMGTTPEELQRAMARRHAAALRAPIIPGAVATAFAKFKSSAKAKATAVVAATSGSGDSPPKRKVAAAAGASYADDDDDDARGDDTAARLRRIEGATQIVDEQESMPDRWMISPASPRLAAWSAHILVCIVVYTLVTPVVLAFEPRVAGKLSGELMALLAWVDLGFLVDVVLRFFTGYVEGPEQRLVMNRAKVVRRYLRGEFLPDAVTAVPFFVLGAAAGDGAAGASPLLMFKMIKLVTAYDDIHVLQHLVDLGYVSVAMLSLLKIVGIYFLIIHMDACCYWRVSLVTEADGWDTPMALERGFAPHVFLRACGGDAEERSDDNGGDSRCTASQYLYSLNWAVYATCGGVDTSSTSAQPFNGLQEVYVLLNALVGVWLLAGLIGSASGVIAEINSNDNERKENLSTLDNFLDKRDVPDELKKTIRTYFMYIHDRQLTSKYRDAIALLPPHLQRQLHAGAKMRIVGSAFKHASETERFELAALMQTTLAHPMQMVTHQDEPADGVRVMAHGRLVCFMRASPWPRVLRFVEIGECFGDETLLTHLGPTWRFSSIAHNHSEIFLLPTADLKAVMKRFPSFRCTANKAAQAAARRVLEKVAERILAPFVRRFLARRGMRSSLAADAAASKKRKLANAAAKVHGQRRTASAMKLMSNGPARQPRLARTASMVADASPFGFEPKKGVP